MVTSDRTGVVVTGGARGIGRATAAAFVAAGARVAIGDLDAGAARQTAGELGPAVAGFELDVSRRSSWRSFLKNVEAEHLPQVDVLVNNAGVMPLGAFTDEDIATSRQTLEVDLWGVILGMRAVLDGMSGRGRGHVVNVASSLGEVPVPGAAVYCAAKAAVIALSRAVRYEVRDLGVTVSAVLPAFADTDLTLGVPADRFMPVTTPQAVADAIVGSCGRPKSVIHVPRWLGAYRTVEALLPDRAMDLARRIGRHDRVLTQLDQTRRNAYDQRLRSQRNDDAAP